MSTAEPLSTRRSFEIGLYIVYIDLVIAIRKHLRSNSFFARVFQGVGIAAMLGFMVVLHVLAFGAISFATKVNPSEPVAALAGISTIIWNFLIFVMASGGLIRALVVLHEQDDTDLLITSPTSIRTILAARLFGNTFQSCSVDAFIILPWIDAMILAHGWRYLFGFPIWFLLSIFVTSLDGLLTLTLVRIMGLSRARIVAQVVPFILVFVLTFASLGAAATASLVNKPDLELPNFVKNDIVDIGASPFSWAARAATGDLIPFFSIAFASVIAAWTTLVLTEKPFLEGVKSLREGENKISWTKIPPPFSGNLLWLEMKKNYKLIYRTPMIMVQALSQALAPIGVSIVLSKINFNYGFGYFVIFVSGIMSGVLSIAAGTVESCDDLLVMSPRSKRLFKMGKILTGCSPMCILVLGTTVYFAIRGYELTSLAVFLTGIPLSVVSSYVGEVFAEPTPIGQRPKLMSSPLIIIPLFGMQMGSGIIAAAGMIGSAFTILYLIPCLVFCYLILFMAWGLSQLKGDS